MFPFTYQRNQRTLTVVQLCVSSTDEASDIFVVLHTHRKCSISRKCNDVFPHFGSKMHLWSLTTDCFRFTGSVMCDPAKSHKNTQKKLFTEVQMKPCCFAPLTCSECGVTLTGINEAHHSQRAPAQVTHTPATPQTETQALQLEVKSAS